jgi:hypothetical protein
LNDSSPRSLKYGDGQLECTANGADKLRDVPPDAELRRHRLKKHGSSVDSISVRKVRARNTQGESVSCRHNVFPLADPIDLGAQLKARLAEMRGA